MKLYITWSGDHISRDLDGMAMRDDAEGLRRAGRSIERGNETLKSWLNATDGQSILVDNMGGRAQMQADHLHELEGMRDRYKEIVGATASVGIGSTMSEAEIALNTAKIRGGNRALIYSPAMKDELEENKDKLDKAEGPMKPSISSPASPIENAPTPDVMEGGVSDPEQTHAAKDFEQMLHDAAGKQDQEDTKQAQDAHQQAIQARQQVAQVLQSLREQAPVIEQIKGQAPKVYKALVALTQNVISMARLLTPQEGLQKAEQSIIKVEWKPSKDSTSRQRTHMSEKLKWPTSSESTEHVPLNSLDYHDYDKIGDDKAISEFGGRPVGHIGKLQSDLANDQDIPPVSASRDGTVWDGSHRLTAAKRLGISHVPVLWLEARKAEPPEGYTEDFSHVRAHVLQHDPHAGSMRGADKFGLNQIKPDDYFWPLKPVSVDPNDPNIDAGDPASQNDVAKYTIQAKAGSPAPAVFGVQRGIKTLLLDGKHRKAAAQSAGTPLTGFIGKPKVDRPEDYLEYKKKPEGGYGKYNHKTQQWMKAELELAEPYISVEGTGKNLTVKDHKSKKEAHEYGMDLRRQGKTAFVYSKKDAAKHGLDPRETTKGELPMPHAPKRTHLNLPVGTTIESSGRFKVSTPTGVKWKEGRTGLIMSKQPETAAADYGHATSSLRPSD